MLREALSAAKVIPAMSYLHGVLRHRFQYLFCQMFLLVYVKEKFSNGQVKYFSQEYCTADGVTRYISILLCLALSP